MAIKKFKKIRYTVEIGDPDQKSIIDHKRVIESSEWIISDRLFNISLIGFHKLLLKIWTWKPDRNSVIQEDNPDNQINCQDSHPDFLDT